ncbi:MAG: ABC transporter ATP-binding protein [Pseudomonadota bacterium]|nr:ABC transporter ATP-binding protein [Pseudomonadota bacterium]
MVPNQAEDSMRISEVNIKDLPPMGPRRFIQLLIKAWPFMRPLLKHWLILVSLTIVISLIFAGATLVGTDLFNNKILVGDKLQPLQAKVLLLGESYTSQDIDDNVNMAEVLSEEERKVVRDRFLIWVLLITIIIVPTGAGILYYNVWIWQMLNQNLRVAMMSKAESLSLKFHAESRVGDAIFRIYKDSSTITSLISEAVVGPINEIYIITIALIMVAFFEPWIALVIVLAFIPVLILTIFLTPAIRYRALENRVANSDLTSRLQETMKALRVVKANQGERKVLDGFRKDSQRALDAALYLRLNIVTLNVIVALIFATLVILSEYFIAVWVLDQRETFMGAAVVTIIGYAVWNLGAFQDFRGRLLGGTQRIQGLIYRWALLQDLFIGLERAFYLVELEAEIIDPKNPIPFPRILKSVEWRHVTFSYGGNNPVLRDINLRAEAGTITALVGKSGAGKSTLMSLLLRLYDLDQGEVLFNDTSLPEMRTQDIRQNVAIALQKQVLFSGSVAHNIAYGSKDESLPVIEEAAKIACAHNFISELENGYDTDLGESGGRLSTGQKQRISLARAIIRDPKILILDEPTSALDAETEMAVMKNLRGWGEDKIIFIVTHRVTTIRHANQIVVLKNGQVEEIGSHDELASSRGTYTAFLESNQAASRSLLTL